MIAPLLLLPVSLVTTAVEPVAFSSTDSTDSMRNVSAYILGGPDDTASGDAASSGQYLRLQVGGNFAFNASFNRVGLNALGTPFNLDNGKIKFDPGVDFQATWGIAVWDALAIELSTGFAYNSVSSVEGDWTSPLGPGSAPATGGSGSITSVPLVIGLGYEFEVAESFSLGVNAGVGAQFTYADISDISAVTFQPFQASIDGWATSFRYQVGVTADWALSHTFELGVYVRYSGTTQADFGTPQFNIPGEVGVNDLKVDDLSMLAVGLSLNFRF